MKITVIAYTDGNGTIRSLAYPESATREPGFARRLWEDLIIPADFGAQFPDGVTDWSDVLSVIGEEFTDEISDIDAQDHEV